MLDAFKFELPYIYIYIYIYILYIYIYIFILYILCSKLCWHNRLVPIVIIIVRVYVHMNVCSVRVCVYVIKINCNSV